MGSNIQLALGRTYALKTIINGDLPEHLSSEMNRISWILTIREEETGWILPECLMQTERFHSIISKTVGPPIITIRHWQECLILDCNLGKTESHSVIHIPIFLIIRSQE